VELLGAFVGHVVHGGQGAFVPHELVVLVVLEVGQEVGDHAAVEVIAVAIVDLGPQLFEVLASGSVAGLAALYGCGDGGHQVVCHARSPRRRTPGIQHNGCPAFTLFTARRMRDLNPRGF
jgi:hypothetical protein